jgi:hypothetical protein
MANKNSHKSKTTTEALVAAPAIAAVVTPVAVVAAVAAPAEKASQKGGKKKAEKKTEVAQVAGSVVAATPVAVAAVNELTQKGTTKTRVKKQAAAAEAKTAEPVVAAAPQKGGKKTAAPKAPKTARATKKAVVTETAEVKEVDEKSNVRSFKVKLPDSESFEGRFTGLTPYQAANKALSKYFRETNKTDTQVTFSICESTRNSKKNVYTYNGMRHKLEVPVKYTIQDGREIVKNFKNSLKKIKKSEEAAAASA